MRPFVFETAADPAAAMMAARAGEASYLAGGTTLLDLMKLDVMRPARVVDINALAASHGGIAPMADGLRLGALVRMADAAAHPGVRRDYPVIADALRLAASAQLRNMASLGGNVLQRTRCEYFRDVGWPPCNKRDPGSGCAALDGVNRAHAVLGTSEHCIATYPGDFAQALIALDATVRIARPGGGTRAIPFANLHRAPGNTPQIETDLEPGELIVDFFVPSGPWTRRSRYLKIRDRESYEFALAAAAVALELAGDEVRSVRIALGGVATRPWRAHEAEAALAGRRLTEENARMAAEAAFAGAVGRRHNRFKIELGRRTLVRALREAQAMKV
jgi:xanthine dehydrogenase YagS FAD-binding subunit